MRDCGHDAAAGLGRQIMITTRFAPSPNGHLHLGHAFSAIIAHDLARAQEGRFLLRIEDIDGARSRPELADEFRRDLEWLGLEWEEVAAQSTRLDSYDTAVKRLLDDGLLYPCICTRAEIECAAFKHGPEGAIYPGTCKGQVVDTAKPFALRLNLERAKDRAGAITWSDDMGDQTIADPRDFGDVVLVRKDAPASYHLAATLDDAADGVTLVTRGEDLRSATHIHRLLQALLGLSRPDYHHHPLLLDESGQKLAKRRGSPSLADRRAAGEDGVLLGKQLRLHSFPAGISLESA